MQNFCIAYRGILSKNELYATGTTGRLVEEVTNLNIHKFLAGHLGGNQQLGAQIEHNQMDLVIFLRDPLSPKPHDRVIPILVEVNMAEEESKFGTTSEDTAALIMEISKLRHVSVKGLMTVAPDVPDPEMNRGVFRNLRKLSVDIANKNIDNVTMDVLSMGMTGDYVVAIEEGATMVRVGTGLFGKRDYGTASH